MDTCCAPLALRSNFSLLRGASRVGDILDRLAEWGCRSAALADVGNLYGAMPFYDGARERGVKPILGCELRQGARAVLLARDFAGYSNLCRILSRQHLDAEFSLPDAVADFHGGLHVLTDSGPLAERLARRMDRRYLWLMASDPSRMAKAGEWAGRLGLGVVATPDADFLDPEDYDVHRVLTAIRLNELVPRLRPEDLAPRTAFLPRPEAFAGRFRGCPEALANNRRIAEDCNLELPLGKPIFPQFAVPEGETAQGLLKRLCEEGLARRYRPVPPRARERLRRELDVIGRLGFTEYFLFVWDILGYARRKGVPTIGRGSGASSMVAYLLGITSIDPLDYAIPFERFLHLERPDCPDLDVDLCWLRRDDVIASVYEKYGADRVAMVSIHSGFQRRGAFRDVAKAFGVSNAAVSRMLSRSGEFNVAQPPFAANVAQPPPAVHAAEGGAPGHPMRYKNNTVAGLQPAAQPGAAVPHSKAAVPHSKAAVPHVRATVPHDGADVAHDATLQTILRFAKAIQGFPRHVGVHCGGLVIGDRPLDTYVPLERAAKGVVITQYEKDAVERIGLVKMDFLGNHGLTVRDETIRLVRNRAARTAEQHGTAERQPRPSGTAERQLGKCEGNKPHPPPLLSAESIPPSDPAAERLLRSGLTLGCCQLESPAMRHLVQMLQAASPKELMRALALVRPGASSGGGKEEFVCRVRGLSPAEAAHPLLAPVFSDSLGMMLYEDDAMLAAAALAGATMAQGDRLRKAIQKARTPEALAKASEWFVARAAANGVPRETAEAQWKQMARFASYSFCKAHAASYGLLAWQTAWLKAHFPVEFMASVLNHHWGMYPRRVHVEEARRMGIPILPPDVNRSSVAFCVEKLEAPVRSVPVRAARSVPARAARSVPVRAARSVPVRAYEVQETATPLRAHYEQGTATPLRAHYELGIRVGLGQVKGLSQATMEGILAQRARRPFVSLTDFMARVKASAAELESLILCGAFDFTGRNRPQLVWEARCTRGAFRRTAGRETLFAQDASPPAPPLPDYSSAEKVRHELAILEMSATAHPVSLFRPALRRMGVGDSRSLRGSVGKAVRLAGILDADREAPTLRGDLMEFLTLEDEHGVFEATLFPKVHRRFRRAINGIGPYLVHGVAEEQYGVVTVNASGVERLDAGLAANEHPPSMSGLPVT